MGGGFVRSLSGIAEGMWKRCRGVPVNSLPGVWETGKGR